MRRDFTKETRAAVAARKPPQIEEHGNLVPGVEFSGVGRGNPRYRFISAGVDADGNVTHVNAFGPLGDRAHLCALRPETVIMPMLFEVREQLAEKVSA